MLYIPLDVVNCLSCVWLQGQIQRYDGRSEAVSRRQDDYALYLTRVHAYGKKKIFAN